MKSPHALAPSVRRTLTTTVALATAMTGLATLSPAAQAASASAPTATSSAPNAAALREGFTIPAGKGTYTATSHGVSFTVVRPGPNTPANYCILDVETLLDDSNVEGYGSVSCEDAVYEAAIEVVLFYGATEENYALATGTNTFFVYTRTFAPAQVGNWQTGEEADVFWTGPSSYTQYGPSYSPWKYINI